jgi:hypothetical protein
MRSLLIVLLGCFAISLSQPAMAQLSIRKGIKAGLNVANLRVDSEDNTEQNTKNGILGGFFLEIDPIGPLALQGEVLFTQKGSKVKSSDTPGESDIKINYLEVPLLVKLQMPLAPPMASYAFFAGPAVSFKLSEDINGNEGGEDIFKSSDLGGVVGASLGFSALGLAAIVVDLRYTLGLSDILKDDFKSNSNDSVKNGVISLSLGLSM